MGQVRPHVPRDHRMPPARAAAVCDHHPRRVEGIDDTVKRWIRLNDYRGKVPGVDARDPVREVLTRGVLFKGQVGDEGDLLQVIVRSDVLRGEAPRRAVPIGRIDSACSDV